MKKLCSLLLVLVMLFTMAGCSKGSESNDIAKGDKTQGDNPIELTMWTMHTTEAMIDTLNAQVKAFESQNPDIKIKIETLTYDVVYQRMMAGMNSDTCLLYTSNLLIFRRLGFLDTPTGSGWTDRIMG